MLLKVYAATSMDNFGCRLYLELDTAASDFENLTHDWHSILPRAFWEGRQLEGEISNTSDFSSFARLSTFAGLSTRVSLGP